MAANAGISTNMHVPDTPVISIIAPAMSTATRMRPQIGMMAHGLAFDPITEDLPAARPGGRS
ncbi:MAG: hypothetical protein A2177_04890 [Spirochaetes bacterium RBG_13_68_11]|nr:MAG: hypothetical protein A2177_04890 [Spirochaetes bacterium RBG_13_68_11]